MTTETPLVQEPEFIPFQKIPRWSRDIVITEKIDGTNGVIYIPEVIFGLQFPILAGSRNRWLNLTEKQGDNFGFARWVQENQDELLKLGPGYHHGEWWGPGVNKRYTITPPDRKRFSLFHPKWQDNEIRPACCHAVPILYAGEMSFDAIRDAITRLEIIGSVAAPGNPAEGIVIYHTASRHLFKKTLEQDEKPKGSSE